MVSDHCILKQHTMHGWFFLPPETRTGFCSPTTTSKCQGWCPKLNSTDNKVKVLNTRLQQITRLEIIELTNSRTNSAHRFCNIGINDNSTIINKEDFVSVCRHNCNNDSQWKLLPCDKMYDSNVIITSESKSPDQYYLHKYITAINLHKIQNDFTRALQIYLPNKNETCWAILLYYCEDWCKSVGDSIWSLPHSPYGRGVKIQCPGHKHYSDGISEKGVLCSINKTWVTPKNRKTPDLTCVAGPTFGPILVGICVFILIYLLFSCVYYIAQTKRRLQYQQNFLSLAKTKKERLSMLAKNTFRLRDFTAVGCKRQAWQKPPPPPMHNVEPLKELNQLHHSSATSMGNIPAIDHSDKSDIIPRELPAILEVPESLVSTISRSPPTSTQNNSVKVLIANEASSQTTNICKILRSARNKTEIQQTAQNNTKTQQTSGQDTVTLESSGYNTERPHSSSGHNTERPHSLSGHNTETPNSARHSDTLESSEPNSELISSARQNTESLKSVGHNADIIQTDGHCTRYSWRKHNRPIMHGENLSHRLHYPKLYTDNHHQPSQKPFPSNTQEDEPNLRTLTLTDVVTRISSLD